MTNVNIDQISYISYRTDILTNEGKGKYYIRQDDFENIIQTDLYDIGGSEHQCNPIIADKIILYSDVYYSEVIFSHLALGTVSISSYEETFNTMNRLYIQSTPYMIWLKFNGFRYNTTDGWEQIDTMIMDINLRILPTAIYNNIDFDAGFFIHIAYDPTRHVDPMNPSHSKIATVRDRFCNEDEAADFINTIDEGTTPEYYDYAVNYISDGFAQLNVGISAGVIDYAGEIRVAYKTKTGDLVDFDSRGNYVTVYQGYQWFVPFTTDECIAAECANAFVHIPNDVLQQLN